MEKHHEALCSDGEPAALVTEAFLHLPQLLVDSFPQRLMDKVELDFVAKDGKLPINGRSRCKRVGCSTHQWIPGSPDRRFPLPPRMPRRS